MCVRMVFNRIARSHDVNEPDTEGNRALCVAAQNQCVEVLELLLENGADVDLRQRDVEKNPTTPSRLASPVSR